MAEATHENGDEDRAAVRAVLRLLAGQVPGSFVLLACRHDHEHLQIEEAYPPSTLARLRLRLPKGLLAAEGVSLETGGERLSLGWTQLYGRRPGHLASMPVPGADLHLVTITATRAQAGDADALAAAADVVADLLRSGQATQREKDVSRQTSALINNLPGPLVFVDSRDMQVLLNERARLLLRLPANDVHERAVARALAGLVAGVADEETRTHLARDPRAAATFEIVRDDRTFKVETSWVDEPDLTGRIWQFTDITLEKTYHADLAELASLLQLTIDNVRVGVALVDRELRMMLWNEEFLNLLGFSADMVATGSRVLGLVAITIGRGELGPDEPGVILARVEAWLRADEPHMLEFNRKHGRILDIWRKPLVGDRSILVVRDVTDERQAARLRDELVSTVSHELRTPLTSIMGSLRLVKAGAAGPLAPDAMRLIDMAERNSARLNRLVNDLLDLDKLQRGKLAFQREPVDAREMIEEAAAQNGAYAQAFDVAIALDLPKAPVTLEIDRFRMLQVMGNLISNAAKFSPAGEVITIRLAVAADRARISVSDRGRGISPEFRQRIFTRFAQEDSTPSSGVSGTGLGLAISKSIVDQHGGTITVDPDMIVGTTFHVDLPLGIARRRGPIRS